MTIEHERTTTYFTILSDGGNDLCHINSLEEAAVAFRYLSGLPLTDAEKEIALSGIRQYDNLVAQKMENRKARRAKQRERRKANKLLANDDLLLPDFKIDDLDSE